MAEPQRPAGGPDPTGAPEPTRASAAPIAELLRSYAPPDDAQEIVRREMEAFLAAHPQDAHCRGCLPGHFTGSALLLDATGQRVLLTHHRKLGRWLQLGGHADGEPHLHAVARREAEEESGIHGVTVDPAPIDLDIHRIPARPGEPEHLHLDVRFLARAPAGAVAVASAESHELAWFTPEAARQLPIDASLHRLLDRVFPAGATILGG